MNYGQAILKKFYSGSKNSRGMSDVEPIMIYQDEETEDGTSSRNELLQRIIVRYEENNRIIDMKSGFIAFIKHCIFKKKVINLTQVLQKVTTT